MRSISIDQTLPINSSQMNFVLLYAWHMDSTAACAAANEATESLQEEEKKQDEKEQEEEE